MAGKCPDKHRRQFIHDSYRLTTAQLARKYNRAQSTIREWRIGLLREGQDVGYGFPASQTPTWEDYEELEGDAIIISDLEIPDHDAETLDLAASVARRFGIKTLIIAGDLLAHDHFSTFQAAWVPPSRRSYQLEINDADRILEKTLEHFSRVVIITGNHDARLAHITKGYVTLEMLFRDKAGITVSWYRFCYITSGGKRFLVTHPVNYSKRPLAVASDLSLQEDPRCGVISAHTHHLAVGWDVTGHYQIAESGCVRSIKRTQYKQSKKAKYPEWVNGFLMLRRGYVYPFATHGTDWEFWLSGKGNRPPR